MKSKIMLVLTLLVLISCNNKELDLSKIDFNQKASIYLDDLNVYKKEEQKGHYVLDYQNDEVSLGLKDDGERVVKYTFMEEKNTNQLNYSGLRVNDVMGVSISVYDEKISFMRIHVKNTQTLEFFDVLKKKLGNPTEILIKDGVNFDDKNISQKMLIEKMPNQAKKYKDEVLEQFYFSYPEHFIWVDSDIIYQLTIVPVGNYISNSLVVISKKALKDKVIFGFHNPNEDPILSKYLN